MIKVKRIDIQLYKGFNGDKPTDLEPIQDIVNEIGEDKILYITCASRYPSNTGCFAIFYHED